MQCNRGLEYYMGLCKETQKSRNDNPNIKSIEYNQGQGGRFRISNIKAVYEMCTCSVTGSRLVTMKIKKETYINMEDWFSSS